MPTLAFKPHADMFNDLRWDRTLDLHGLGVCLTCLPDHPSILELPPFSFLPSSQPTLNSMARRGPCLTSPRSAQLSQLSVSEADMTLSLLSHTGVSSQRGQVQEP